MLVEISKIKVSNRIRKDFGDIEELAEDIKLNTLLNPVTVVPTPEGDYQLIAGERRLRACKMLGMNTIYVNEIEVKDAEQALRIEIAENENRKGFSFREKVEWARRVEDIEKLKARERQATKDILLMQNFAEADKGLARDAVAEQTGFGSGEQYRKAKFVSDNADEEMIRQLDEKEISVHAAYQKLRADKEAAEAAKAAAEQAKERAEQSLKASDQRARQLEEKHQALQAQIDQLQSAPSKSDEHRREINKLLKERNGLNEQLRIMRESYEEKLAYFDRRVVWMKDMRKAMNRATAMLMTDLSTALADFMSFTDSKEAIEMMDHFFTEIDKVLAEKKARYRQILNDNEIEVTRDGEGTFNRVGRTIIIDGECESQEGE